MAENIVRFGPDGKRYQFPVGTPESEQVMAMDNVYGNKGNYIDNIVRSVASGASMGFADEFAAKMGDLTGIGGQQGNYARNVAQERARNSAFGQQSPIASTVAEIGGAIASPITRMVSGAVGATNLPRYAKYFAEGVGLGALTGAGNAKEGERTTGATIGGTMGGAFGVALPAAAEGLGQLGRRLLEKAMTGPMDPYARRLSRAFERDALTIPEAQRRLQELGPEATIADLGGNVRGLAETVAQMPGKAASMAEDVMGARQAGTGERIIQSAFKAVGVNSIDDLIKQRADAARPLYEAAFADNKPVYSAKIEQLLANPEVRKGIKQGLATIRNEADALGQPVRIEDFAIKSFNEAGDPVLSGTPTLRLLDAAKRGLDDILEQYRDPVTRRLNLDGRGRSIEQIRKSLVNELDDLTKDQTGQSVYKAAREAWSGPTPIIEALDKITKTVERSGDNTNIAAKLFKSPAARKEFRALFPDEASFDTFSKAIDVEKEFTTTARQVLGNSRTQFRNAAQADLQDGGLAEASINVLQNPNAQGLMGEAFRALRGYASRPPTEVADALANPLFSPDPIIQRAALNSLRKRLNTQAAFGQLAQPAQSLLLGGARVGGYSGGMLGGSNQ
jgi:hypothetical protein